MKSMMLASSLDCSIPSLSNDARREAHPPGRVCLRLAACGARAAGCRGARAGTTPFVARRPSSPRSLAQASVHPLGVPWGVGVRAPIQAGRARGALGLVRATPALRGASRLRRILCVLSLTLPPPARRQHRSLAGDGPGLADSGVKHLRRLYRGVIGFERDRCKIFERLVNSHGIVKYFDVFE